ncbi:MAG TPA: hypothetical protein VGL61_04365 [Kofleriaceae bacterium]|jgi:hypothetical protein
MREQHFGHIEDHELAERRKTWLFFAVLVAAIVLVVIAVLVSI